MRKAWGAEDAPHPQPHLTERSPAERAQDPFPAPGGIPSASQLPRSEVCTLSAKATGQNVSTAQAPLDLSTASRAVTPARPSRLQSCSKGGKVGGEGLQWQEGPGAPCAQRGHTWLKTAGACPLPGLRGTGASRNSPGLQLHPIHPSREIQATRGFCLPGEGSFAMWWPPGCWALFQGAWSQSLTEWTFTE